MIGVVLQRFKRIPLVPKNENREVYQKSFYIVLLSYIFLYLIFLYKTHFLPYVFDNNETFAALIQAQNMFYFGIKKTFGLTEEAYGFLKTAHPYVYTHQGNFPRFYTYFLYVLGARKAELQITITTLTIGLIGMGLCYHFFAKTISRWFALIFCLLLMSDYIMFMQWQVNIWRVWQLFFFFSCLLCSGGLYSKNRIFYRIATVINFACLFYTETTFACFVFFTSATYLLFLPLSSKQKVFSLIWMGVGSAFGIMTLILQNVAYLGWDVFLKDLSYTFLARNQTSLSSKETINHILEFYHHHKIVFWVNFNNSSQLRTLSVLVQYFYRFCLLPYTPFLTLSAAIVFLGTTVSCIKMRNPVLAFKSTWISRGVAILTTSFFLASLVSLLLVIHSLPPGWRHNFLTLIPFSLILAFLILGATFIVSSFLEFRREGWTLDGRYSVITSDIRLFLFFFSLICIGYIIFKFHQNISILISVFQGQTVQAFGSAGVLLLLLGIIIFIVMPTSLFYNQNQRAEIQLSFRKLTPFLVAALVGFIGSYMLFPGYINSAYFARYCCFTIFAHMALYAWLFYVLSVGVFSVFQDRKSWKFIFSCFLLCLFVYAWISLQFFYLKTFPPNSFSFVNVLKEARFQKKSIVSNAFAAPFSFLTGTWAYLDPAVGYSQLKKDTSISPDYYTQLKRDPTYLWFADVKENPRYKKPFLFICWRSNYSIEQLVHTVPTCGSFPLIKNIRNHKIERYGFKEIVRDETGRDQWSIVSLPRYNRQRAVAWRSG